MTYSYNRVICNHYILTQFSLVFVRRPNSPLFPGLAASAIGPGFSHSLLIKASDRPSGIPISTS